MHVGSRHPLRHDWILDEILDLYARPFLDLISSAHQLHGAYFDSNAVQLSTLISLKSGGCPEDCAYCPQSARHNTSVTATPLMDPDVVLQAAGSAKAAGATRFCMGAAWRSIKDADLPWITDLIKAVKDLDLETCVTLGMVTLSQAKSLKAAGLDYYNHNLDTSEAYYTEIISTRSYQDRLDTLDNVRQADLKICCGGILGLGESRIDRANFLRALANLPQHPESVPLNRLVHVEGTPANDIPELDLIEFIRTVAVARIMMPRSNVRLSAGRGELSETEQAMCFMAGANSVFYGEELLTTANAGVDADLLMFDKLGISAIQ